MKKTTYKIEILFDAIQDDDIENPSWVGIQLRNIPHEPSEEEFDNLTEIEQSAVATRAMYSRVIDVLCKKPDIAKELINRITKEQEAKTKKIITKDKKIIRPNNVHPFPGGKNGK